MTIPIQRLPGHYDRRGRFHVHRRVARLITRYGGQLCRYLDLPPASQMALAWYMAIDGEAWALSHALAAARSVQVADFRQRNTLYSVKLRRSMAFYRRNYGQIEVGYVPAIPLTALITCVMRDVDIGDYPTWQAYHDWFVGREQAICPLKHWAPRDDWPVILASFADETLQDGWNRFHCYAERGLRSCAALFFPRSLHEREEHESPADPP